MRAIPDKSGGERAWGWRVLTAEKTTYKFSTFFAKRG